MNISINVSIFSIRQREEYFDLHLYKPWTHLSVYAIGVACGLLMRSRKKGSAGGPYGKAVRDLDSDLLTKWRNERRRL